MQAAAATEPKRQKEETQPDETQLEAQATNNNQQRHTHRHSRVTHSSMHMLAHCKAHDTLAENKADVEHDEWQCLSHGT
jgi:hypothetical protein